MKYNSKINCSLRQYCRMVHKRVVPLFQTLFLCLLLQCNRCNPSAGNFAFIGYWDIPAGETYTFTSNAPNPTIDFIARVYYPSYDESIVENIDDLDPADFEGITLADGEHPLIIFGHGRYSGGVPNNYLGMTHLMNHLASWGYVCVSVNLDVVHSLQSAYEYGIPHRGELLLKAIDKMLQLNNTSGSIFHGGINTSQIALIGHSRGGGGAISAINRNHTQGSPRSIKAVGTISPVDFGTDPVQADVPHISLYGTWDGDLSGGDGQIIWDGGVRSAHKHFVEIYGANHFHFTDAITYSWEVNEISREDHHQLAQGFFNAYFDEHVRDLNRYQWPSYLSGQYKIAQVNYYLQILNSEVLVVDNADPVGNQNTNNLNGPNDGTSLATFDDMLLTSTSDHFYNTTGGLIAHWDNIGDNLIINFAEQNVAAYDYLHFRACQRADESLFNNLDEHKNFRIRLEDGFGSYHDVSIKDYLGGLQYPDFSGSLSAGNIYQYKSIPRSYRIPLADFTGVNLSSVTRITFLFNHANEAGFDNISGAIAIDDIEFSM